MSRRHCATIVLLLVTLPSLTSFSKTRTGSSQQAVPQGSGAASAPRDYSKEPFVVERTSTKVIFQNDGTFTQDGMLRVHVLSQAGLQNFGVLHFQYTSATSTVEIIYVRVIKPDKSVTETPSESAMDITPDITQQAPQFSDLKEKQIAVKGFEIGDTLEYEYRIENKTALIPGQFWYAYNFNREGIVLDEELQLGVPGGRTVKVKSPDVQPTVSSQEGMRVYDWKTANLERKTADKDIPVGEKTPPPSVQLSSFGSWDEVGKWFQSVAAPQAGVTPAIQAKADFLVKGAKTELEKIQALYAFVSLNFRYIGISLGIGRYQPHSAAEVLGNGFGDCKDKHTLFVALLSAEGIKAYPTLIGSTAKLDSDVPSPFAFDHVITAIPQGTGLLFLDTTPGVAPFGYIQQQLRDVQALMISGDGTAKLVQTPADAPFKSFFTFQADGTLDDAGTLVSKMEMTFRGDDELPYRLIFRQAGQPQWKDVMQRISSNLGFGGEVSDVVPSSPEAVDAPFQIAYAYNRKEYSDWANRRISPPFPPVFLPEAPDDKPDKESAPLKLQAPYETSYQGTVQLPKMYDPSVPATVDLHESFADYHAEYLFTNGTMHFQRRLVTKTQEVPVEQLPAYRKFYKAVVDDSTALIPLSGDSSGISFASGSPEVEALLQEGRNAAQRRDMPAALDAFQRAEEKDPSMATSWFMLGSTHLAMGDYDKGVPEMKRAISLDPQHSLTYKVVALTLRGKNGDAALELWRALEAVQPQDLDAPKNMADILIAEKRYKEAAAELDPAVQRMPGNAALILRLGQAELYGGDKEKGATDIVKAADMDGSPLVLNEAASSLADNNVHLDEALHYADESVRRTETATGKISLDTLTPDNVRSMPLLAQYWDTLGWVQFRLNHGDLAEKYITAAWKLSQSAEIADHLGQICEKLGRKQDAIRYYSLAVAVDPRDKEAADRRGALTGTKNGNVSAATISDLMAVRTVNVPRVTKGKVSAEFFVLFARGVAKPMVSPAGEADAQTKAAANVIATAKYDVAFPDDGPAQIIRRGIFSCDDLTRDCEFVMYPPDSVKSVN